MSQSEKKEAFQEETKVKNLDVTEDHDALGHFNEDDYIDSPPDGGYDAWMCCACVSAMNMVTWGANSAFGVFLAFYLDNNMFPGASATDYALIGGLVVFFTLLVLPYSSIMLVRYGYRITVFSGMIVQIVSYIGASFATTIVQLYWTQGILMGISSGIIFGANSIVLPGWFLKKRALANGFSHFGLGLGGAVFSLVVNALIQKTGNQKWALRTLGIISFIVCGTSMLFVKVRQSQQFLELKQKNTLDLIKDLVHYKVWLSVPLQLCSFWAFLANMGYIIFLFSLSNYSKSLGFSDNQSTIVLVMLSIAQAFGRPLSGFLSDKVGRVNFSMFGNFYICVFAFVYWINISNYASLVCFAIFLGLLVGISSVNIVTLVVDVTGLKKFPSGLFYSNSAMAVSSLISEVIALNLRDYSLVNQNPYFYCQLFVGSAYFAALLILIPFRFWKVNRMFSQLKDSKKLDEEVGTRYNDLLNDNSIWGFFKKAFYPVRV